MRTQIAAIVVAPLILGSLPAFAQGSPSADQIINSLKPSGNLVTGGTRDQVAAPTNEGERNSRPLRHLLRPSNHAWLPASR